MNKKNLITLLVLFTFCGTLFGCGNNSTSESLVEETTQAPKKTIIATEKPTEAPTEAPMSFKTLLSDKKYIDYIGYLDGSGRYDKYLGDKWLNYSEKELTVIYCDQSDFTTQTGAITIIQDVNEMCGFSAALLDRMTATRAIDGVQYEENDVAAVTWYLEIKTTYNDKTVMKLNVKYHLN